MWLSVMSPVTGVDFRRPKINLTPAFNSLWRGFSCLNFAAAHRKLQQSILLRMRLLTSSSFSSFPKTDLKPRNWLYWKYPAWQILFIKSSNLSSESIKVQRVLPRSTLHTSRFKFFSSSSHRWAKVSRKNFWPRTKSCVLFPFSLRKYLSKKSSIALKHR